MRKTRTLSVILALCLVFCLAVPAFAADVTSSGGTGNVPVSLTAAATTFSVTVPTSIAIEVGGDGTVTCPAKTAVVITNNSAGPVQVTNVSMKNGTWNLVSYNGGDRSAIAAAGVDSKKLGFQIKAGTDTIATATDGDQALTIGAPAQWVINGADTGANTLQLETAAIASAVSGTIAGETAATIVFTIAWKTA